MRALVLALSILAIVDSAHLANAGLSSAPREDVAPAAESTAPAEEATAPAETASVSDEATEQTEQQIGLTKAKRRAVQRGLTRLGFDTKANGKFDDSTRAAIKRWQEEHDYPATGFLNVAQHKELTTSAKEAAKADRQGRRRTAGRGRGSRGVGGPIGAIGGAVHGVVGGVVGGIFGR